MNFFVFGLLVTLWSVLCSCKGCSPCFRRKSLLLQAMRPPGFSASPSMITPCQTRQDQLPDELNTDVELAVILEPIQLGIYPPGIVSAKENILQYIFENQLDLTNTLLPLLRYSHHEGLDLMISALSRIRATIQHDYSIKSDLQLLISYLISEKYATCAGSLPCAFNNPSYPSYMRQVEYIPVIQQNFYLSEPSNAPNLVELITTLAESLLQRSQCGACSKRYISDAVSDPPLLTSSELPTTPFPMLPFPTTTPVLILPTFAPTAPPTTTPVPTTTTPVSTTPPPPPPPPPFAFLVETLPHPKNAAELEYYQILSAFLQRADLSFLLGNSIDINGFKNKHDLLKMLLARSISLKLDATLLAAIKFYLEYEVSLASLSIVTQKQIQRRFDLSKIFLDTLDLQMLNDEQRGAFDAFFHFILNITADKINNFDTWTEAHTKGEFMRILFAFFLEQSFVPDNIKVAIQMLVPLVKMDGEGASPP